MLLSRELAIVPSPVPWFVSCHRWELGAHAAGGMQRLAILFASALVALALCAAEESYSGLDDEISPPVGSTAPGGSLSYAEALRLAQEGKADQAVLGAFRKQYADAKEGGTDESTLGPLRVNLAAVLLDVANKVGEPDVWLPMYKEAQMLSHEALALDPQDDAAQANLKAATNSISFRQSAATGGVAAPKPAGGSADVDMESARALLLDDDDDDDEDDQDGGIDEPDVKPAGGGVLTYAQAMVKAQEGKADNDVLQAFRDGLASAEAAGNADDIASKKTNLAAILIDLAKTENDPAEWEPMYEECIKMCDDVLQVERQKITLFVRECVRIDWRVPVHMCACACMYTSFRVNHACMHACICSSAYACVPVSVHVCIYDDEIKTTYHVHVHSCWFDVVCACFYARVYSCVHSCAILHKTRTHTCMTRAHNIRSTLKTSQPKQIKGQPGAGWSTEGKCKPPWMPKRSSAPRSYCTHAHAQECARAHTHTHTHPLSLRQQPECRSMTGCQRRRGPSGFCLRMTRMKKMSCEHSGLVSVQRHHTIFFPFFFRQAVTTRCWQRSASLRGVGMGEGE